MRHVMLFAIASAGALAACSPRPMEAPASSAQAVSPDTPEQCAGRMSLPYAAMEMLPPGAYGPGFDDGNAERDIRYADTYDDELAVNLDRAVAQWRGGQEAVPTRNGRKICWQKADDFSACPDGVAVNIVAIVPFQSDAPQPSASQPAGEAMTGEFWRPHGYAMRKDFVEARMDKFIGWSADGTEAPAKAACDKVSGYSLAPRPVLSQTQYHQVASEGHSYALMYRYLSNVSLSVTIAPDRRLSRATCAYNHEVMTVHYLTQVCAAYLDQDFARVDRGGMD